MLYINLGRLEILQDKFKIFSARLQTKTKFKKWSVSLLRLKNRWITYSGPAFLSKIFSPFSLDLLSLSSVLMIELAVSMSDLHCSGVRAKISSNLELTLFIN